MKNKFILHIDMNSYFASVEQQANPFLRGRSVGVCAYDSPGGCIIASSVEAKAVGIKTGCRVRDAKRLDPRIVIIENEPAKYRSTTERIFNILSRYTDKFEPYSIDEAFLDLTGWVGSFEEAKKIAQKIQIQIKQEVGEWLDSSVGISWTKFLAKFASDIAPKREILVINKNNLDKYLDRPVIEAWGIGASFSTRLNALGIFKLIELKKYDSNYLRRIFGSYGYYFWANVNGEEITCVQSGVIAPKSIGHSYCLPKKTTDKNYLSSIYYKLTEKTGRRLRDLEMEAQSISIVMSFFGEGGIYKSFRIKEKMFTTEEIFRHVNDWLDNIDVPLPARMLAVSVSNLVPLTSQMSLFNKRLEMKELSCAMDKLNNKYGEYTVVRGAMFGISDMARDRIGFRKTVVPRLQDSG